MGVINLREKAKEMGKPLRESGISAYLVGLDNAIRNQKDPIYMAHVLRNTKKQLSYAIKDFWDGRFKLS